MKTEDFNKTIKELEEQENENNEQINISDERTRMASINQIDYKLGAILSTAIIPYFGLTMVCALLENLVDITTFTNIFTPYSIPIILAGSSLGIGTIINKSLEKKWQTKERFHAFSKAKTEAEKVEEEVFYRIELEKANNRNQVIQKTIDTLESNNSLLQRLSSKYDINEKNVPQTENSAKKKLEELSPVLEQKYNELDILTTQKVLSESFWRLRCKGQKGIDLTLVTMGGGSMPMMLNAIPFTTMNDTYTSFSLLTRTLMLFIPLVVGALGTSIYWTRRNKVREIALNKLNNKLDENALPKQVENTYNETQELLAMIERKISDISVLEVQFKETQRVLERITSEHSTQIDLSQSLGRNSVENIINNSTQFPDEVAIPTAFEILQTKSDISWVQPYLEEDIEEDVEPAERTTGDNQPSQGRTLARRKIHNPLQNKIEE